MLGEADLKDIGDDMQNAYVSGLREQLNIPEDSKYISTSFKVEYFRKLVEIVKEENLSVISASQRGDVIHLSAFISAEGIKNTKELLEHGNKDV